MTASGRSRISQLGERGRISASCERAAAGRDVARARLSAGAPARPSASARPGAAVGETARARAAGCGTGVPVRERSAASGPCPSLAARAALPAEAKCTPRGADGRAPSAVGETAAARAPSAPSPIGAVSARFSLGPVAVSPLSPEDRAAVGSARPTRCVPRVGCGAGAVGCPFAGAARTAPRATSVGTCGFGDRPSAATVADAAPALRARGGASDVP